jgi:hypothetical protein
VLCHRGVTGFELQMPHCYPAVMSQNIWKDSLCVLNKQGETECKSYAV